MPVIIDYGTTIRRNHPELKMYLEENSAKSQKRKLQSHSDNESDDLEHLDEPPSSPAESISSISSVVSSTSVTSRTVEYSDELASTPSTSTNSATLVVSKPKNKQPKLGAAFATQKSFQDGGGKANEITNAILFLIAKNNLPFSLVESEGFKILMKKAAPLYKVPSRKVVTELIEEKYDCLSAIVKQQLSEVDDVCLTTDVWTEPSNTKSFLGLTAHYLVGEEHNSVTIGVEELTDRHTADYLAEKLSDLIAEWNIAKEKLVAVVSDSAANIKKAISDAFGSERHLPCFAHLLNLVPSKIIDGDEIVNALCVKVKTIVTYFKKSVIAADKLRAVTNLKLKQSVDTRWNSTYEMLVRFVDLADKVSVILLQCPTAPEMLTAAELQVIKEFILLLDPFFKATQIVCGEKYFTGSKTIPVVKTIKSQLDKCITNTDSGNRLKALLNDELCKRFTGIEQLFLLSAATILDPRFKKLHFSNHLAYSGAINKIMMKMNVTTKNSSTPCQVQLAKVSDDQNNFWSFHEAVVISNRSRKSQNHNVDEMPDDLRYYLNQDVIDMSVNPITYWNNHMNSPLSRIARRYLTVIATSVPSERLFSRAGNIMTDDRNRLTSLHLQQLLFLNSLSVQSWKL